MEPAATGPFSFRLAGADEWARLLNHYQNLPLPSTPDGSPAEGPAAEARAFLLMLQQPVNEASIRQGIDFLNATDALRYYAVLPSLFRFWAARNPDAAQAAVPGLRDPQARDTLAWEIFHARTVTDPMEALAKAKTLPSLDLRAPALHAIASTLKPDQIPEILRASMRDARAPLRTYNINGSFQKDLVLNWAETDLQAPVKFAVQIEDPAWRKALLETALQAQTDLWRNSGTSPETIPTLRGLVRDARNIPGISSQLSDLISWADPDATAILSVIPDTSGRQQVMADATYEMLWRMGAAKSMVPEEMQAAAGKNLENLAAEAAARGWSGEFSQALLQSATTGEIPQLTAAARWISGHDPATLDELIRRAATRIPYTTAEWLGSLPPGSDRDHAVSLFAETHAAADPERAAAWAGSITDPARRAAALAAVGRQTASRAPQ